MTEDGRTEAGLGAGESIDTRLTGASLDIAAEKRRELLELFPEVRTEGGSVDFDRLRLALGNSVDSRKERYGLSWPGKSECFKTIQAPSMATLLPVPEKSVNFDATENLIIEGDNLEVLKLLQKPYLGKIKMIYIDPPYNTGNDFIYPDDFSESLQTYLQYTGQVDADGRKFSTNTDADGRFHSKWLNMLYPRLYLAQNLLAEGGLIFVSCDDNEDAGLRFVMNDIFGEEHFVAQLIWQNKTGAGARSKGFIPLHEYIVCYAKAMPDSWNLSYPMSEKTKAMYTRRDEYFDKLGPFATWPLDTTSMDDRSNLRFPILHDGHEIWPRKQWLWSKERVEKAQRENKLTFSFNEKEGTWSVRFKGYLFDEDGEERLGKPTTVLIGPYTQEGTRDFASYLPRELFPFPKPVGLLSQLISISTGGSDEKSGIYLDFFAGSGTMAESVLKMNSQDRGERRFILVQLPEPTGRDDHQTISEITRERVQRAISKLEDDDANPLGVHEVPPQDRGFRLFKLARSNVKEWDAAVAHDAEAVKEQLALSVDHLRHDRGDLDIVYEVLLKSGYPLSAKVSAESVAGKRVYSVADGAFLICLERNLTLDLIRAIAAHKPERVLLLDEGFAGNDQLKTNAVQTFKTKNIVFRTL